MNLASIPECETELVRTVRQDLKLMLGNLDSTQPDQTTEPPPYSRLVVEFPSRRENYQCYFHLAEDDSEVGLLVGRKGGLGDDVDSYTVIAFPGLETTEIINPRSSATIELYRNGVRMGSLEPCGWRTFLGQQHVKEWKLILQEESVGVFLREAAVSPRNNHILRTDGTKLPLILARHEDHWLWQILVLFTALVAFPLMIAGYMPHRRKNQNHVLSQEHCRKMSADELWFYFTVSCYFRFVEFSFDDPVEGT